MTKEQDDTLKYGLEFTRVIRMYYGRMQAKLAEVGLYRGQPPILGLLHQHDGMSQKEMARALNLSPATMTVTLKRMERRGWCAARWMSTISAFCAYTCPSRASRCGSRAPRNCAA